jgi:hypothetical protein
MVPAFPTFDRLHCAAVKHDRLYGVAFLHALANIERDQIAGGEAAPISTSKPSS